MSSRRIQPNKTRTIWMFSTRLHVVMYSVLLVATPFLMVRNYLQVAIGEITDFTFPLLGSDIPTVPAVALALIALLLVLFRAHLSRLRILAGIIVLLMIGLAQRITDFYAGFAFYDLQQNWHYVAYGIFAFIVHRDLAPRRVPLARIVLIVYVCALLYSSFDEAFQRFMSTRVFDISDIAKDVCGSLMGLVLIVLGGAESRDLLAKNRPIRQRTVGGYARNPLALLILLAVLTYVFLFTSSLLTEFEYWNLSVMITIGGFLVFFLLIHVSQFRWGQWGLVAVVVGALVVQTGFFIKHRGDHIVHHRPGLTVYKGIPIVFFDLMILPNGIPRLVDRKETFNLLDRRSLMRQRADIVVVGAGADGRGGRGFPTKAPSQFVYNRFTERGTQVILLRNAEALGVYNRLRDEHKNVLLVLHNR